MKYHKFWAYGAVFCLLMALYTGRKQLKKHIR